jgi:hypothetical protein
MQKRKAQALLPALTIILTQIKMIRFTWEQISHFTVACTINSLPTPVWSNFVKCSP